jgi:hypothetical protein
MTETTPSKRRVQGPPGVPCPLCNKLAGALNEGEVEDYQVEVSGDQELATVSVTGTLFLSTACCGEQFKSYSLEAEVTIDHECDIISTLEADRAAWKRHLADDGRSCACTEDDPDKSCQHGGQLPAMIRDNEDALENSGDDWGVDGEGEPEPYQRYESTRTSPTGKVSQINSRYARSFRGFTVVVTVSHAACGNTEEVSFGEGAAELPAGAFETV